MQKINLQKKSTDVGDKQMLIGCFYSKDDDTRLFLCVLSEY